MYPWNFITHQNSGYYCCLQSVNNSQGFPGVAAAAGSWLETWHGGDCGLSGYYFHFLPINQPEPEQWIKLPLLCHNINKRPPPASLQTALILTQCISFLRDGVCQWFTERPSPVACWQAEAITISYCQVSSMRKSKEIRNDLSCLLVTAGSYLSLQTRENDLGTAAQSLVVKLRSGDPRVT